MSGFDAVRRRRLRTRRIAVVCALAVAAGVFVTSISSPPASRQPSEIQGRTWVPVQTDDGPRLVLVNGISGLIEAQATTSDPQPEGVEVVASTVDRTVLGSAEALTVVDNGRHVAVSRTGVTGSSATLVGDRLLTLGDQAELHATDLDGAPTTVPVPADIVADVAPVVDDDGRAWLLGDDDGDLRAFGLRDNGSDLESHDVPDTTTDLLIIDGSAHATGPDGTAAVHGDSSKPTVSGAPLVPTVAEETDGLWVAADQRELVILGAEEHRVRLDDPVTGLAIWNGSVVASTSSGAVVVSESGEVDPITEITEEVRFHTAGGLLWLTSRNAVVAIWADHTRVPFELAAVDLDLCIGTCTADDVARFLDEQPQDPATDRSTTTLPPRQLEPPPVDPTVPTTTAPPTTTTAPDRPSTTRDPDSSSTSVPTSSTTEVPGPPDSGSSTTDVPDPAPDPDPQPEPEPEPSWPTLPPPTQPPPTDPTPPPTTPSTTTTTEPAADDVHIVLELAPSAESTVVSMGLLGSRRDCRGAGLASVDARIRWSGVAEGSRAVRVPWRGGGDSEVVEVTIDHSGGGILEVTMEACRLSATRTATIPGEFPDISGISLAPSSPRPGEAFTARVGWDLPEGWEVTSTAWSGGVCGATAPVGDSAPRQEQVLTAEEGRFCVSVIVTLSPPDGGSRNEERAVDFEVAPTTTAPPPTTTTTEPPATTTTTTEPPATTTTTTQPTATTTTTEPSDQSPDPPP